MSQFGFGDEPGLGELPGDGLDTPLDTGPDPGATLSTDTTESPDTTDTEGDGMTRFVHEGNAINYTPAADTPAGTVVLQGDLIGVTRTDIAANRLGSLAVDGVFDFPKATTAGTGFTPGAFAYWDNTSKVATKTATGNKLIGKAVAAAADAAETVRVRLSQ